MKLETIQKLKDYFEKREDISMAFLFGSQAKGQVHKQSDTDIAVYFKVEDRQLEWEETKEYQNESEIWSAVEKIAETQSTDLVVLNRAPSTLAYDVISTGIPLLIRDKSLYWRFLFLVSEAAEDFYQISQEWMDIRARSQSLGDKDKNTLLRLVDFTENEINHLQDFVDVDQHTYERNRDIQLKLERWIERLAISLIDIAKLILSSEKKKALQSSSVEMVKSLGWAMNVSEIEVNLMGKFAELRNLLAHQYLDLRYAQIRSFLDNSEPIYHKVIVFAKEYIAKQKI